MTRTEEGTSAGVRRWPASAVLWVVTLSVMCLFQFWRGAPIDGAIFGVIAVGLVVERVVRMRQSAAAVPGESSTKRENPPTSASTRQLAIAIASALVAALVIIGAPRTGPVSIALIAGLGVAAIALVWNRAERPNTISPESRRRSRITWASVGIALCLWEAVAYILSVAVPRGWIGFPTVSLLLEPAVNFDPTRALLTVAWLALGVWLIVASATPRSPRTGALRP